MPIPNAPRPKDLEKGDVVRVPNQNNLIENQPPRATSPALQNTLTPSAPPAGGTVGTSGGSNLTEDQLKAERQRAAKIKRVEMEARAKNRAKAAGKTPGAGGGGSSGGGGGGSGGDFADDFASVLNGLLPWLSPEDKRTVTQSLWRLNPTAYAQYNPLTYSVGDIPAAITDDLRDTYMGQTRAQNILGTLNQYITDNALKLDKAGDPLAEGLRYLQQVAGTLNTYGASSTAEGMSGLNWQQYQAAVNPLLEQGGNFQELARMIMLPFFSAGSLQAPAANQNYQ